MSNDRPSAPFPVSSFTSSLSTSATSRPDPATENRARFDRLEQLNRAIQQLNREYDHDLMVQRAALDRIEREVSRNPALSQYSQSQSEGVRQHQPQPSQRLRELQLREAHRHRLRGEGSQRVGQYSRIQRDLRDLMTRLGQHQDSMRDLSALERSQRNRQAERQIESSLSTAAIDMPARNTFIGLTDHQFRLLLLEEQNIQRLRLASLPTSDAAKSKENDLSSRLENTIAYLALLRNAASITDCHMFAALAGFDANDMSSKAFVDDLSSIITPPQTSLLLPGTVFSGQQFATHPDNIQSQCHSRSHSHSNSHANSHSRSYSRSHSHSHPQSRSQSRPQSRPQTQSHSRLQSQPESSSNLFVTSAASAWRNTHNNIPIASNSSPQTSIQTPTQTSIQTLNHTSQSPYESPLTEEIGDDLLSPHRPSGSRQRSNESSHADSDASEITSSGSNERWPVTVKIFAIDYDTMTLSASMEAFDVPSHPSTQAGCDPSSHSLKSITTYLEGEIVDFQVHTLLTENFSGTIERDAIYWRKLPPFNEVPFAELSTKLLSQNFLNECNLNYVLMRWKERCFVHNSSDTNFVHQQQQHGPDFVMESDGCGLTISGFYYISMRRSDGLIEGLYCDPASSPYQYLRLKRTADSGFQGWTFR